MLGSCGSQAPAEKEQTDIARTSVQSTRPEAEAPDIRAEIQGMQAGKAYLIGFFAEQQFRQDSAMVDASGSFQIRRDEPFPRGFYYLLLPDQTAIQMLLGTDQTFSLKTRKGDLINSMEVEGSEEMKLLADNLKFEQAFQARANPVSMRLQSMSEQDPAYAALKQQQDELVAERKAYLEATFQQYPNAFFTAFKQAGQNPEVRDIRLPDGSPDIPMQVYHYRSEFWDGVDFKDERLLRTPVISNKLRRYMTELTDQNPDSVIKSADVLIRQVQDKPEFYKFFTNWIAIHFQPGKVPIMDAEAIFVHMAQQYFTPERAFWAEAHDLKAIQDKAREMNGSLLGQKGQEVQAPDPSGKMRSTTEINSPYMIVYIYSPGCDHCIEETPHLVNFYKQWKNKGVGIYAIAIETNTQEWKDFIAKNGMQNMINVHDTNYGATYGKYFIDNTPEIYVLDSDRNIIAKNLEPHQIAEVIEKDQKKAG